MSLGGGTSRPARYDTAHRPRPRQHRHEHSRHHPATPSARTCPPAVADPDHPPYVLPDGWAFAGIGAGLPGIGTIVTSSSMVNAIYDKDDRRRPGGDPARSSQDQTAAMFAFHTVTSLSVRLLLLSSPPGCTAGSGRPPRLRHRSRCVALGRPRSAPPSSSISAAASTPSSWCGIPQERRVLADERGDVQPLDRHHPVAAGPLAGLAGAALSPRPAARGGVPRWIGWSGLVARRPDPARSGVSPLQYMAGMPGALWLLVTSVGFLVGDKAYRSSN